MPLSIADVHASTLWLTSVVEINRRVRETLEREAGLSATQYRILLELGVNEGRLMCGTLATLLFLSPAAVTHAVGHLFDRGLATRDIMESNRRVTLVGITAKGADELRMADERLVAMLRRDVWSDLSPDELGRLLYSCSTAVGPFVGRTLLHGDVAVEPCYITCAIIQERCYENLLGESGFALNEFRICLYALGARHGLRSSELADALLLNRSSTSRAVSSLKQRGALASVVCADDSRASELSLTDAGEKATRAAFARMVTLDRSICVTPQGPAASELDAINTHVHRALRAAAERDRIVARPRS